MDRQEFCNIYWKYYKSIEKDFLNTIRFVELDLGSNGLYDSSLLPSNKGNSEVYSTEYVRLYLATCSEIDVICKAICKILGDTQSKNMPGYTSTIFGDILFNDITNREVRILPANGLIIKPFSNWKSGSSYNAPDWWPLYNFVKHNRINNYKDANLKNVINALGGLYIFEMYLIRKITKNIVNPNNPDVPNSRSELFEINNWNSKFNVVGDEMYYKLEEDV